jgi:serine/threonine protein kinase
VSLNPGDLIQGKYRIIRLIGQGGMGAVYEGENVVIARRVAIKILHGILAGDVAVIERFEREAQAAGRIGNDHIIEVLDMGRLDNNDRFMVMEYLDGETLDQRCDRLGVIAETDVYPIVRQLLTGLSAAHAVGIVHRDLKPDNIFILQHKAGNRDFVKIIDFGISKFTAGGANFKMTTTGAIMGTPYYMAPEQAKGGKNVDIRSDIYAVGVVMFRALTGQVPFQADSFNELIFKIALSDTPQVQQIVPGIDVGLNAVVYRAMARNAEDRYQNAAQFRDALDLWAEGRGLTVPGRGSQTSVDRLVSTSAAVELGAGTLPTEPAPANTHVPWSNSGVSTPGGKGKRWAIIAAAALGAVAVYAFGGETKAPSAENATAAETLKDSSAATPLQPSMVAVSSTDAVARVDARSDVAASPAQEPAREVSTAEVIAPSASAKVNVSEPVAASSVAKAPRPRPAVRPAKPVAPRPAPVEPKPAPKPSAKPKPKDVFGY